MLRLRTDAKDLSVTVTQMDFYAHMNEVIGFWNPAFVLVRRRGIVRHKCHLGSVDSRPNAPYVQVGHQAVAVFFYRISNRVL